MLRVRRLKMHKTLILNSPLYPSSNAITVFRVSTVDCQPSGPPGALLVFVSGNLQLAGEQHALQFSQLFHLMPAQQGSFYVHVWTMLEDLNAPLQCSKAIK